MNRIRTWREKNPRESFKVDPVSEEDGSVLVLLILKITIPISYIYMLQSFLSAETPQF